LLEQQSQHSSEWAKMQSIAAKIGCTAETLRKSVHRRSGTRAAGRDCPPRSVSG